MNGRQAKKLRALAGVNKENHQSRSYRGTKVKTKQLLHPVDIDVHGNPVVIGTYKTATYVLNQGSRLMNKLFKKQFKAKQGIFALT